MFPIPKGSKVLQVVFVDASTDSTKRPFEDMAMTTYAASLYSELVRASVRRKHRHTSCPRHLEADPASRTIVG